MAVLNTKMRNAIPTGDFALPGRRYPIEDKAHADNALSRVSQNGTPDEQAKVKAAVHAKYGGKNSAKSMLNSLTYKLKNGQ